MPKKIQQDNTAHFLPRVTVILAKIAEVLHWWLAGAALISTVVSIISPSFVIKLAQNFNLQKTVSLSCYGYEVVVTSQDGGLRGDGITIFLIGSIIVLSLMAMIFRNVYLILKTADGKTWFTEGNTPFQKNIVRMFREIGIFFIAISVMSLISEIFTNIAENELNTGFNYLNCFIGLVFLCISQFFNYGTRLERDLDGLV